MFWFYGVFIQIHTQINKKKKGKFCNLFPEPLNCSNVDKKQQDIRTSNMAYIEPNTPRRTHNIRLTYTLITIYPTENRRNESINIQDANERPIYKIFNAQLWFQPAYVCTYVHIGW